jgi:hypothetical protein
MKNMHSRVGLYALAAASMLLACGGGGDPKTANDAKDDGLPANHKCGEHDKVQQYDLHDEDGQDHFAPCAETGKEDFSGNVHLDTTPEGIKITIRATDDDVNEGKLGSDLKGRDAMIVFPKGRDKKGVEIPLVRTKTGYKGEKVIPYADLDKLTDEGTKLEVSIYDNDDNHKNGGHEEQEVRPRSHERSAGPADAEQRVHAALRALRLRERRHLRRREEGQAARRVGQHVTDEQQGRGVHRQGDAEARLPVEREARRSETALLSATDGRTGERLLYVGEADRGGREPARFARKPMTS